MYFECATTASLIKTLAIAQSGDIILLAPGHYGQVWLQNLHFSGQVMIASQDGNDQAVIEFLNIRNSSGLTFSGIEIGMEAGGGQGVRVTSSTNIRLDEMNIHGVLDGDPSYDGTGVLVEDSSNVSITGNGFHDITSGVGHKNTNGLTISDNDFRLLRADGIAGNDSDNVVISGNHFTNFFPLATDHADAIQFWQTAQSVTTNITITENVIVRGEGEKIQGIFMTASTLGYEDMVIAGNAIVGGLYHGITVAKVTDLEIHDNLVLAYDDLTSWILVQNSNDVRVTDNQVTSISVSGGSTRNVDVVQSGNVIVGKAAVGDASALEAWSLAHTAYVAGPRDAGGLDGAETTMPDYGLADATTSVATLAYQFFTGKIPTAAGLDYLVSPSGPNPNNLNSAYYQDFNIENRYINFAVNLGKLGEGRDGFVSAYGGLTLEQATKKAYGVIFGAEPTNAKVDQLLDATFVISGQTLSRADYFALYGGDGLNGIGTKAAVVGFLLVEAEKADLGVYAKSNAAFLTDLADGAAYNVDLIGAYSKPEYTYLGG
ncbi:right-handed parallel beta-helix repeat-containing protein, partial [uncultured Phenylobacterium sp.]|uniref:right-handed parallel beta-helix repeat-containing protein n=1 Tax=uncultured Phenylobacterium sp. TaxID=349273 RepID=UPI0025CF6EDF